MKKTLANKMWPSPTPQNCQQLKKFKVKERVDMYGSYYHSQKCSLQGNHRINSPARKGNRLSAMQWPPQWYFEN